MTRFVELGHLLNGGEATSARFADHLGQIALASFVGVPGIVVDAPIPPRLVAVDVEERRCRGQSSPDANRVGQVLGHLPLPAGGAVPRSRDDARLVHGGLRILGLDFCIAESAVDPSRTSLAHLLRAGVLVIENLCNLSALPTNGFRFYAVLLGTTGRGLVAVRAFAELRPQ